MEYPLPPVGEQSSKPISIGVTCWLWQWGREKAMRKLAEHTGVTLQLTQRWHGLHREIEGHVSGPHVDRFISEFARHG
jgi:hypothetical protein